ncbi:MAG: biotin--[Clostridia bacterium]|nr:biotin--[acetyl-CoA-carboxylase] ligase [Clostridia bacterium]
MLKEQVLELLAHNRASYLSGQAIAAYCGVSRTAVWKAIQQLEGDGVSVTAKTHAGYRLAADVLTPYDVALPAEVSLFFYESIDSTNTQAKRLLAEGLQGEALLVANEQTAGRGRCGRSFYSPKDTGIYYSYIFHPAQALSDAVLITTAAAVSVVRAIERTTALKPSIKWVNDVYLGDKKVCGILTEAVSDFESGTVESVIVGIGINFNTSTFPAALEKTAGSLQAQGVTRAALLQAAVEELRRVVADVKNPAILEDYRAHSLVLGKKVTFLKNGQAFCGTAVGIEPGGALQVQTESGLQSLSSGEISVRLND